MRRKNMFGPYTPRLEVPGPSAKNTRRSLDACTAAPGKGGNSALGNGNKMIINLQLFAERLYSPGIPLAFTAGSYPMLHMNTVKGKARLMRNCIPRNVIPQNYIPAQLRESCEHGSRIGAPGNSGKVNVGTKFRGTLFLRTLPRTRLAHSQSGGNTGLK